MSAMPASILGNDYEASLSNMLQQTSMEVRRASTSTLATRSNFIEGMPVEILFILCDVLPVPDLVCLALTCPRLYEICKEYYRVERSQSYFRIGLDKSKDIIFPLDCFWYSSVNLHYHRPESIKSPEYIVAERIQEWRGLREYRLLSVHYGTIFTDDQEIALVVFLRRSVYGDESAEREDVLVERYAFHLMHPDISPLPHNMGDEWDVEMNRRKVQDLRIASCLTGFPGSHEWDDKWRPGGRVVVNSPAGLEPTQSIF
jgi:hypothetical protein